jgi:WD40 repeat protein
MRRSARFFAVLGAIALVSGATQAAELAPSTARCLNLDGGSATDAAFSPAGDLLAVILESDSNAESTITLLRWPSGDVVGTWTAWAEDAMAVDPSGRIYWSAWVLDMTDNDQGQRDGIYSVVAGSSPALFVTGDDTELNDLTWTRDGLRGTTASSHLIATIGLAGDHSMDIEPHQGELGAFWASPDNSVSAVGGVWSDHVIEIADGAGTRSIDPGTEPRSIALSPDGRTLVVASWFNGTRIVDTATGAGRLILRGSQAFVALSAAGDLAWANDEQVGQGRLCVAKLADL